MTRRTLTEEEKLVRKIAKIVNAAKCRPSKSVETLIAVAARAAVNTGSHSCGEFQDVAHMMYHSAEDVIVQRGDVVEGAGGFKN